MAKVMMLRPGEALGDACWATSIPRLLNEQGHEVYAAVHKFVQPIYANSPYISGFITLPPQDRWGEWEETCLDVVSQYDKTYHLHGFVEVGLLHRTDVLWGGIPNAFKRRENAKGKSYQDEIFINSGVSDKSELPEFYFTDEELQESQKTRDLLDKDNKKLIVWQWDGSSRSKNLIWSPKYLDWTMEHYPEAVHYVFSYDRYLADQIPNDSRVFRAAGQTSIRETLLLTKIADLVIGPESFLINAAAAFDTPKIVFFSHSAPENLTRYFKNCSNILPETDCSPCYLIQTHFQKVFDPERRGVAREFEHNCMVWNKNYRYEGLGYKCCYFLPHEKVYEAIDKWLK